MAEEQPTQEQLKEFQRKRAILDAEYDTNYKKMKGAWDAKHSKLKKSCDAGHANPYYTLYDPCQWWAYIQPLVVAYRADVDSLYKETGCG